MKSERCTVIPGCLYYTFFSVNLPWDILWIGTNLTRSFPRCFQVLIKTNKRISSDKIGHFLANQGKTEPIRDLFVCFFSRTFCRLRVLGASGRFLTCQSWWLDFTASCNILFSVLFTGQSFKFGSFGDGNGELNYPCYVTVNSQGHIIVSDMHSHRIQVCFSLVGCSVSLACKGIPYLLE